MRSKWITFLIALIAPLLFSFSLFKTKNHYADIARQIRAKAAHNLSRRHNMDCIGIGGGMMGSVYMIGLSFQVHHPMDQNEARERIVDCAEEILKAINENEEIRPYLKNYPFTTQNLQVAIYINYPNGREVLDPDFCVVSIYESDDICYSYVDDDNSMKYKKRVKEPYKEVLAIVRNKQGKIQPSPPSSNLSINKKSEFVIHKNCFN